MEKRQDVVHPVRESADELILKFRVFDLHGRLWRKQGVCAEGGYFGGEKSGREAARNSCRWGARNAAYFLASGVTVNSTRCPSRSTMTLTGVPIFIASRA